jgi:hypothetical protein
MKQSQFYYLLRRGLLKSMSVVKEGLVMFNKFTTAGISHPAQGSAAFDGASDYIKSDSLPLSNWDNFTYSAWVNVKTLQTGNVIGFGSTTSNTPLSIIEIRSNGTINFIHKDNSSNIAQILTTDTLSVNDWYFLTATRNGTAFSLYIDGSVSSTATASVSTPSFNTFNIGRLQRATPSDYLDGNLANVAIWNRALSSDEINAVMWKGYQSLTDNEKSGLKAWYSLDDVASPAASLATMEALAVDKDATIENKAAVTAAINALS